MTQPLLKSTRREILTAGIAGAIGCFANATSLHALLPGVEDVPGAEPMLPKSGETLPLSKQPDVIRALLVGGGSSHDFETYFHRADSATLKAAGGITSAYTSNAEEANSLLKHADALVFSGNHTSFGSVALQKALNAFADGGHGIVIVHAATWYNWPEMPAYNQRFVGGGAKSHGVGEFTVFNREPAHPVMRGVPGEFKIVDEQYRMMFDPGATVELLAETSPDAKSGKPFPSVWVTLDPRARIVDIALGHADEAHGNPAFQTILVNAVRWVAAGSALKK